MKLYTGQAFTFKGGDAEDRAREIVAEFGPQGAKIEESRPGFAKIRLLREAVLIPKPERVPVRAAAPSLVLAAILFVFLVAMPGMRAAEPSAPAVSQAAGAQTLPTVKLNGVAMAPLGGGAPAASSTFNVQRPTLNFQRLGIAALTTGSPTGDVLIAFIGGMTAFVAAMKARDAFIGKKPEAEQREVSGSLAISPQPLVVTPAKEWATTSEVAELKEEVHRQVIDLRAYVHEGMHGIRQDLQAMVNNGQEREERLNEKLDQHWQSLNKDRSVSTARVHEKVEAMAKVLRDENSQMDVRNQQRFEKILEKIGELRGQIDGGRKRTT